MLRRNFLKSIPFIGALLGVKSQADIPLQTCSVPFRRVRGYFLSEDGRSFEGELSSNIFLKHGRISAAMWATGFPAGTVIYGAKITGNDGLLFFKRFDSPILCNGNEEIFATIKQEYT